ncbi:hypothetical protein CCGE525_34710 (plasmid) [Rhizobium jaguaris]|uniref:Uncharacterized protein n=1 Tax=Rhizobium jaguaris TaxID=1312183 RepID=A0A387G0C0_9HYPH|nr:hypothetical protein CCGE525_34710 [Rhizobium jaguaris]
MTSFQNVGKRRTVSNRDRMECDICWHVHAPAQGDPLWRSGIRSFFAVPEERGESGARFLRGRRAHAAAPPAGFSCPDLLRKNFRGQRERAA